MNQTKLTPMIRQYLSIKESYPDAVLFYRMGDFYEMFFEDAKLASSILDITLTSRNKNVDTPVPMCGVPYRAAKSYMARLVEKGLKVAVCDQIEDSSLAKGLVKRDVVRVITPGMIIEDEFLDGKTHNFILALFGDDNGYGISSLDISTGTFRVTESKDVDKIREEICRISANEILVPETVENDSALLSLISSFSEKAVTYMAEEEFSYSKSRMRLLDHFKVLSLEGFGCENLDKGISAAGALLLYVRENQKQPLTHLGRIETYSLEEFLCIDANSTSNLELLANLRNGSRQGTLINIIDETITSMGGRRLKTWLRYPLKKSSEIEKRLDAVQEAIEKIHISSLIRQNLKSVYDLQRLNGKISLGQANARDLISLKQSLESLPEIEKTLSEFSSPLFNFDVDTNTLKDLALLIHRAVREDAPLTVNEGGMIKPGFDRELDELIEVSRNGKGWLAGLEVDERARTGINSLKVRYNRVFGYYIEIPKTHTHAVPVDYVRKQTLVNAERYITDELKIFESNVLNAQERRSALEYEIFSQIRSRIRKANQAIEQAAEMIAVLDSLLGLAVAADKNNYHRPVINQDGDIIIENGRHPVVEKMIAGERFVPNSISMNNEKDQILIVTGPNMAGKSTILRQVALTVIMAQMGGFVPAEKASLCIIDKIFTRVGALDNLSSGQSTFMVEMQETANILNNASRNSLVIMDEIGRGTSTFDGLSIAWAVAEYLHDLDENKGVKTLFATHYHQLTDLARIRPRVKNFHIAVKEWNDEIIFLRKLVEGSTSRSYGIQVARLAGIPAWVIEKAGKILHDLENENISINYSKNEIICKGSSKKEHVQLSLFEKKEKMIMEMLCSTDITRMTPIEAMNRLNDLIEKAKHSEE
jgi:DNA mismatch repair protein MutS